MRKLVANHRCIDGAGHLVQVSEYQDQHQFSPLSGRKENFDGNTSYETGGGWANWVDENTFELKDGRTATRVK